MAIEVGRVAMGLALLQAGDAVACAIPLGFIKRDLDRLGCPPALQRVLPVLKGASAVGLLAGGSWPGLRRLTGAALVAYFLAALGFHARAGDTPLRWVPAASLGAVSAAVALGGR